MSDHATVGVPLIRLLGAAINQDGQCSFLFVGLEHVCAGASANLTAPNGQAQQRVFMRTVNQARIDASGVSLIEAHGTGTALGDTIETSALVAVLSDNKQGQLVPVGALKTQLGHLEASAGLAGMIKAVAILKMETMCPNIHFQVLNHRIDAPEFFLWSSANGLWTVPTVRCHFGRCQNAARVCECHIV